MLGKKNVISWNKGTVLNCRQICGIMILFIASSFQCVSIYTKNSHAHMFKWFQQIVSKLSKISGIQRQCHEQIQVFRGNKNPWISTCLWCFQHISHFHFSWSKVPSPLRTWVAVSQKLFMASSSYRSTDLPKSLWEMYMISSEGIWNM